MKPTITDIQNELENELTLFYNKKVKEVGDDKTPTEKAYLLGFSDASAMALNILKTFINIAKESPNETE